MSSELFTKYPADSYHFTGGQDHKGLHRSVVVHQMKYVDASLSQSERGGWGGGKTTWKMFKATARREMDAAPLSREGSPGWSRRRTQPRLAAPLSSGSAGFWAQTHLWWTWCSHPQWQTGKPKRVRNASTSSVLFLLPLMIISSSGGFEWMHVRGRKNGLIIPACECPAWANWTLLC